MTCVDGRRKNMINAYCLGANNVDIYRHIERVFAGGIPFNVAVNWGEYQRVMRYLYVSYLKHFLKILRKVTNFFLKSKIKTLTLRSNN